ncbi:MAG: hypothetical protein ACE5ER_11260 [Nitrospinaceae bacterium]
MAQSSTTRQKVIIGIHGLANKPGEEVLYGYWRKSIEEGLRKNCGIARPRFEFSMAYWADLLYRNQQHDDRAYDFDDLYNDEPYLPAPEGALREYEDGMLDHLRALAQDTAEPLYNAIKGAGLNKLADMILARKLKDLAFYYDKRRRIRGKDRKFGVARKVLMGTLRAALEPHRDREIMLIAHSMGTIIAYDVLRDLGRGRSAFAVPCFVTIGSPLGLPHVKDRVYNERKGYAPAAPLRTPTVVTRSWKNYADRRDPVAFDTHLRGDYGENRHQVRVEDDLVSNDYTSPAGKRNYHKSYGYLRTPELSRHVQAFLRG